MWPRYLARLRKPARFHLELTAPGVSGGQVLPHNDRSRHALARGRTGCGKTAIKGEKKTEKKGPALLADLEKALPVSRLRRTRLHASRRCFPARWRGRARKEKDQRRRGREKSLTRVGGSHREFSRDEGCAGVAETTAVKNGETREE